MATCLNGHANPDHFRYCGACGAPLAVNGGAHPELGLAARGSTPMAPAYVPWPYGEQGRRPPERQLPAQRRNKVVIGILAAVVALTAIAVVVGLASGSKDSAGSKTATSTASGLDDWKTAVCRPGTYFNGRGHLRNADGGSASCQSLNGVIILIGQYTSDFDWRNDVAIFRGASYASVADTNGTCVFVAPMPGSRSANALEPLRRFGFEISTSGSGS
jgi:hypothetical protein